MGFPLRGWFKKPATIKGSPSSVDIATDALAAARAQVTLTKFIDDFTPGAAIVISEADLVFNLSPGERVIIPKWVFAVESASDTCEFELGWTDSADAVGNFTPVVPHHSVDTPVNGLGNLTDDDLLVPPVCLYYKDGVRSITIRVSPGGAGTMVTAGWFGWVEHD